jgi:LmbE family N-acetylglucosaminyl deacetylase
MNETCDLMVIAPHPDDPEFGIGGTVALWTREKRSVVYVVCTSGDRGTDDPSLTPEQLGPLREKEQRAAAGVLGVKEVVFLRYPDQGLEDTAGFREAIVRAIRTWKPATVATCDPYRRYIWHRDHRITGQVVLDALYPYARDRLAFPGLLDEGLPPHKVKTALFWASEDPNYYTDITATWDLKIAALRCHQSQVGGRTELAERLRTRHASLARDRGFALAESFHKVEIPP